MPPFCCNYPYDLGRDLLSILYAFTIDYKSIGAPLLHTQILPGTEASFHTF